MWALSATEPARRVRAVRVTSRVLAALSVRQVEGLDGVQVGAAQGTVPARGVLPTEVTV